MTDPFTSPWLGALITLRGAQAEDIEPTARELFAAHETMRDHGEGYVPAPASRQEIVGELTTAPEVPAHPAQGHDRSLVIARRQDDACVGQMSVYRSSAQAGSFWFGLTIFRAARRQGFGRDAIGALLRGYFDELRYHKANVSIYEHNAPSVALFRDAGFVEEGRLREVRFSRGQHYDELLFGITAKEFRARDMSR